LKAWPRGLRPLRCSFAKLVLSEAEGLRMTLTRRVTGNSVKTVEAVKSDWKSASSF